MRGSPTDRARDHRGPNAIHWFPCPRPRREGRNCPRRPTGFARCCRPRSPSCTSVRWMLAEPWLRARRRGRRRHRRPGARGSSRSRSRRARSAATDRQLVRRRAPAAVAVRAGGRQPPCAGPQSFANCPTGLPALNPIAGHAVAFPDVELDRWPGRASGSWAPTSIRDLIARPVDLPRHDDGSRELRAFLDRAFEVWQRQRRTRPPGRHGPRHPGRPARPNPFELRSMLRNEIVGGRARSRPADRPASTTS